LNRLFRAIGASVLLLFAAAVLGQWARDELPGGAESCLRETGERILLETRAGNWASRDCKAFNIFEGWIPTADAQSLFVPVLNDPPAAEAATWGPVEILGATAPHTDAVLECDAEPFVVQSTGGVIYNNDDSFAACGITLDSTSDYTITARLVTATQTQDILSKIGIMLRESSADGSEHCVLGSFRNSGTIIDCRSVTDGETSTAYFAAPQMPVPECLQIQVDRALQSVKLLQKGDATDCSTGTYTARYQFFSDWAASGSTPLVLLAAASGSAGTTAGGLFDQIDIATGALDHNPDIGSIEWDLISYQVSEETASLNVSLERFGGAAGACDVNVVSANGSASAATHFTAVSEVVHWDDAEAGTQSVAVSITDLDGQQQGNRTFTLVASDNSCPDTLGPSKGLVATITILDADAGFSWMTMSPTDSIIPGIASYGADGWGEAATDYEFGTIHYAEFTNLNQSGAGSFSQCVTTQRPADEWQYCACAVSGVSDHVSGTTLVVNTDRLIVDLSTCPSGGYTKTDLNVQPRSASYQLWLYYGCFNNYNAQQGPAHCFNINGTASEPNDHILVLYSGGAFAGDGWLNVFHDTTEFGLIGNLNTLPLETPGQALQQLYLLGHDSGDSNNGTFVRNLSAHGTLRCPKWNAMNGHIDNNICVNNRLSEIDINYQSTGRDLNLRYNASIRGDDSLATIDETQIIRFCHPQNGECLSEFDAYQIGNCEWTEAGGSVNAIVPADYSAGLLNAVGTRIATAEPGGYEATTFNCTTSDIEDFSKLLANEAGPRPLDSAMPPLYQATRDNVFAEFDGGDTGERILSSDFGTPPYVYPTVAQVNCDPTVNDDCAAGLLAVPESDMTGSDVFVNKAISTMWRNFCRWQPATNSICIAMEALDNP
jgi:hypothetical protein